MYGETLDPKKTGFAVSMDSDYDEERPTLYLSDLEDPDNDDIRDVGHPDFDILFGNMCECVFETNDQFSVSRENPNLSALNTVEETRQWCLSIGMTEDPNLAHSVGG